MAKPATRLGFLQALLALGALAVVVRAFVVQVRQHEVWSERALQRDIRTSRITARRGSIFDRGGMALAATYEAYHVSVAVNELRDPDGDRRLIGRSLGIAPAELVRRFRPAHPYFDGPYDAVQVHPIRSLRGVHFTALHAREHTMGSLARPLLGRTDRESGRGLEGIEAAYDTLLAGTPGVERVWRDGRGRDVPIPGGTVIEPVPGNDLLLTVDHRLQGIAEGALDRGIAEYRAQGGDVVIVDIRTGHLLALASARTPAGGVRPVPNAGALVEPSEPGSTAKIFTAAALLLTGADTTPVYGEGGTWLMEVANNRPIVDTHREDGFLSLGQAIEVSSNIAMSKFSLGLDAADQYRTLRSFGFGTPPGTGFPAETPGYLPLPATRANLNYTRPSWAMGYEFMASGLQMAMAYAAIANGGVLLSPTLLSEVRRHPTGHVLWRHRPDTVRRVLDAGTASRLMEYLRLATDSGGTGEGAQLERWRVVGKTGTAKLRVDGAYASQYRASFAGIFPADAPRFVLYVSIDRPGGDAIYGGAVAAPIVRTILLQALALPDSPLETGRGGTLASQPTPPTRREPTGEVRRVAFPLRPDSVREHPPVDVPDVRGWSLREGIHALHRRGLGVRVVGLGNIGRSDPTAGLAVPRGTIVTLHGAPGT
jgi:cell division protein FtsI (penicillin-binding protein 3)